MSDAELHTGPAPEPEEDRGALFVPGEAPPILPLEQVEGFTVIGQVVNWNHTPSFSDVAVRMEPLAEVRPAQLLGVLHQRLTPMRLTVIQVGTSFEVNPNEVPELAAARSALGLARSYAGEGISTRIFRLAECETLQEFSLRETGHAGWELDGEGSSPEQLARAGDLVVLLSGDMVIQSLGGLPDPENGLFLGNTLDQSAASVTLKPTAFQYHIGIFGNPGQGKSYFAGNLLEEAAAWGIPSLVLDVNGEFRKAAEQLGGTVITLPDPDRFGLSLDLITPRELVAIAPNVQQGTVYAELIELAHDRLRPKGHVTFAALSQQIEELGESMKTVKTSVNAAKARVAELQRDPLIGHDFDFVKELEEKRIVVLDCRFISLKQTQLIAAMAARELQRIGRERARAAEQGDKNAAGWFALYFVDEAHSVIPNDEKVVSTQVHLELARMGRHVRTGMVLSSQSPVDLNPSVLKRVQMRFVFALERDQLRSIQGVLADLDERIVAQLPKLPRGVCAVSGSSELVRHGFLLKVRERYTAPGGATPPVFSGRTKSRPNIAG